MTQADLVQALEGVLRFRGVPFDRGELLAFVEDVWPLAEDDPDPGRWAREFIAALQAASASEEVRTPCPVPAALDLGRFLSPAARLAREYQTRELLGCNYVPAPQPPALPPPAPKPRRAKRPTAER